DDVEAMLAAFDQRRRYVHERINAIDGLSSVMPKGAFYTFVNMQATGLQAKPLASALLEETGVAMIGGPDFGVLGEGYLRFSYANSLENIERACDLIEAYLAQL
ncbi:MAG: aminotransferase class I/II-fold pyridoxal phosphate-dependent enzyme, partial [Pseudomonadota bacterium]